jgi:hypothetical protein
MFVKIKTDPISVRYFATKKDATASGNDGSIVGSAVEIADCKNLRTSELLAIFNEVAGEKVARFADRASGSRRLWGAFLDKAPKTIAGTATDGPEAAQERPAAAAKKTTAKKTAATRKASSERGAREEGPRYQKMTVATSINPYREGSKGHKTFEMVAKKPGKTYHEYVEMGGRPNTLAWMIKQKQVRLSKG